MSDERLRERFQALREAEAAEAPSFERTLARAEASGAASPSRWPWTLAAAAAALWLLFALSGPSPRTAPLDPGTWAMPTDVLLEGPGMQLLREAPAIGTGVDSPPLRTGWNRRILG